MSDPRSEASSVGMGGSVLMPTPWDTGACPLPRLLVDFPRDRNRSKNPGWKLSLSESDSSLGNCDMPKGGCTVLTTVPLRVGGRFGSSTVFRLRRPSNSTDSPSPIGSMCSSWILFASVSSLWDLAFDRERRMAAPPRRVSARGSYSGSSISATVRTWSRSPLKTAESGTSLADLDNCNKTTPEQICKNPMMTVTI
jgi:hypothetical protein